MKTTVSKIIPFIFIVFLTFFLNGCIVFHKVSYVVNLDTPNSGIATVTAYDMRSNAGTNKDFNEDKTNLFQYMLKSKEFVVQQKMQGKDITSRKLYVEDDKLIGVGTYKFGNVGAVEGIKYQGGFHYLNLALSDSVMDTNGEIIRSNDYKRIMWDSTFKTLKFTMFSFSFEHNNSRSLAPYYKQGKGSK